MCLQLHKRFILERNTEICESYKSITRTNTFIMKNKILVSFTDNSFDNCEYIAKLFR